MPRSASARRTMTARYRTVEVPPAQVDRPCPGCQQQLPRDATFCTQCGTCLLRGGTAVSRPPTRTQPNAAVLAFPPPEEELELDEIELIDEIELDFDDLEIDEG